MKMYEKFSVLMSVYYKEKPEFFRQSLESILRQTVLPTEIVIVKDGQLTGELEEVLASYINKSPGLFKIISLECNRGLGLALAEGILNCTYELIARMDTDDLSVKTRFETQLKEFKNDPYLDICGGYIKEFDENPHHIVAVRKVPLKEADIIRYQKRRDAFNHVTVMFKKSKVIESGNYQHALYMEDSLLWANMLLHKAKCKNINEYLVYVRTNSDMFRRRGGLAYVIKYARGRKQIYDTGFISKWDYIYTIFVQLAFSLVPNIIRKSVYRKLLRG